MRVHEAFQTNCVSAYGAWLPSTRSILRRSPRCTARTSLSCTRQFSWLDARRLRISSSSFRAAAIAKEFIRPTPKLALTITVTLAFRPWCFHFRLMATDMGGSSRSYRPRVLLDCRSPLGASRQLHVFLSCRPVRNRMGANGDWRVLPWRKHRQKSACVVSLLQEGYATDIFSPRSLLLRFPALGWARCSSSEERPRLRVGGGVRELSHTWPRGQPSTWITTLEAPQHDNCHANDRPHD